MSHDLLVQMTYSSFDWLINVYKISFKALIRVQIKSSFCHVITHRVISEMFVKSRDCSPYAVHSIAVELESILPYNMTEVCF